jgi:hypothetical protein
MADENRRKHGDRRRSFRLCLRAFAGISVANPLQATPNPLQIRCSEPPSVSDGAVKRLAWAGTTGEPESAFDPALPERRSAASASAELQSPRGSATSSAPIDQNQWPDERCNARPACDAEDNAFDATMKP